MDASKRLKGESILDYSFRLSNEYKANQEKNNRKKKGQFFTAPNIARFMANLVKINQAKIKMLDPGTGTGILTAAVLDWVIKNKKDPIKICLDLYETDKKVIYLLESVLLEAKEDLAKFNHELIFEIIQEDFVLTNTKYIEHTLGDQLNDKKRFYDIIISNPPYFKLSKSSSHARALKSLVYGQPNMYSFFMALSASMLSDDGQMIFITPRSFCSGLYYSKFRKWFVNRVIFSNLHIFSSRKDVFSNEEVLQENIIFKAIKKKSDKDLNKVLEITTSEDDNFLDLESIRVPNSKIIYPRNGDLYILIPTSKLDLEIIDNMVKLPLLLKNLNIKVSTGPVVPFRTKENLIFSLKENNKDIVPLLWMHNFHDLKILWPIFRNGNAIAIKKNSNTKKLLTKKGNYVILKRFSSKEQKKRLQAAVLLEEDFKDLSHIGLENRLNYIYKVNGNLTKEEAEGLATILNLNITDLFFRILNGHTQVNANELNAMPFPELDKIRKIGELRNAVC